MSSSQDDGYLQVDQRSKLLHRHSALSHPVFAITTHPFHWQELKHLFHNDIVMRQNLTNGSKSPPFYLCSDSVQRLLYHLERHAHIMCQEIDKRFPIGTYHKKHAMICFFFGMHNLNVCLLYLFVKADRHDAVIANAALLFCLTNMTERTQIRS